MSEETEREGELSVEKIAEARTQTSSPSFYSYDATSFFEEQMQQILREQEKSSSLTTVMMNLKDEIEAMEIQVAFLKMKKPGSEITTRSIDELVSLKKERDELNKIMLDQSESD